MRLVTAASHNSQPNEAAGLAPGTLFHYYCRGEHLKAKHVGTNMVSGRRLESWALGLVPTETRATILDAGCGWGRFTWPLIEEFGVDSTGITCADSSLGMLETAAAEAKRRRHRPSFVTADIQALPFPSGRFTGAMANHVLYHLPDIPDGVRELARVVNENGWLLATTNSDDISVPVLEFHYTALDQLGIAYETEAQSPFSMENGDKILGEGFKEVEQVYFEDEVLYTTAEDFLTSYKTIGRYRNLLARADIESEKKQQLPVLVHQQAREVILRRGELRSPVRMGAFVCRGPKR